MDMPEINRCFGMFPPKYACYLISLFGLGSGGIGLAGIILYGLVDGGVSSQIANEVSDPALKKLCLLTIGLSSLLLLVANTLLFFGVSASSRGLVGSAKWTMFILCISLVMGVIGAPMSCYFVKTTCAIKRISTAAMVCGYLFIYAFLNIWLYFMVVAYNLEMQL